VRAEDAVLPFATNPSLCFSSPASLDPAKVAGKVVVCTRGVNARVDKSLAVLNAGGIGMVLVDNGGGLVAEPHSVPTVHVTAKRRRSDQGLRRLRGVAARGRPYRRSTTRVGCLLRSWPILFARAEPGRRQHAQA
jgi:hypothetical protein